MKRLLAMVMAGLAAIMGLVQSARAEVLLTINVYDPSAVVFSATSGASSISTWGSALALPDFFTENVPSANIKDFAATLLPVQGGPYDGELGWLQMDDRNLLIWPLRGTVTLDFVQGETAFQGSATLDLSSVVDKMLPVGETGLLFAYQGGEIVRIGDFQVISQVPEPGGLALCGVAVAGLLLMARRKCLCGKASR